MIRCCATACRAGLTWCVSPFTGEDGRPSFSKLVTCALLALAAAARPMPTTQAVAVLAAAFGVKVFLAWLDKTTFTAADTAAVSLVHETKDTTARTITEQIVARRDADAGIEPAP